MKPYWKAVVAIVVLLLVQAVCDLSLPNYTSKIIDVGIQNSGVEYATPTVMRQESFEGLQLLMTEDEKQAWQASYTVGEDGYYHLTEDAAKDMEALDEQFTTPILMGAMLEQMDEGQLAQMQAAMAQQGGNPAQAPDGTQAGEGAGQMPQTPPEGAQAPDAAQNQPGGENGMPNAGQTPPQGAQGFDLTAIREEVEAQMAAMGESLIHSTAVNFTKTEYEAVGLSLADIQSGYLWRTGGLMLAITLGMAAAAVLAGLLASRVGAGVGRDLREKVFNNVVGFSSAEINKFSTASLITRSTNDIQQIQMVSTMILRMVLYAPLLAIGGIFMVLRTGAGMEWIIGVAVLAIVALVAFLMAVAMPKFKLMQVLVDKVNLVAREILTGLNVIRAFGREKVEEERFDGANRNLTKTMLFTNRTMTFMMPIMMLIMNGISVLIVWTAAGGIDAGTLEVGTMTAFITYTMQIVMSFLMICMISIMLPRAAVAAERIDEVVNTKPSIYDSENAVDLKDPKGVVAFHHVDFKYPGAEGYTLQDIDFTAQPGQTTAIIGSTGSGKSTLINLIPRFFDVTDGQITLDGVDVRQLTQSSLRAAVGLVPQKGVLFSGTIESNILYGAPDAGQGTMEEAAAIAQATDFIAEKAEGYDSPIAQGGSNVSGGQRQRLSIARAIAKDPKVYIFDDSFSALDFKTDTALRRALGPKVKDATVLIVAQRISTILYADQILVLDEGRLVGKGRHGELLKNCETYRQIAQSQLSPEELGEDYGKAGE
ncbi:ATP-binding cassette domain-containing protein [Christensenellaceae bacterium NSJ-44]|uniref:ATP-binding cassette domain-containing protein n=2 Tax=Luoshenia tenuis TaxID=2763654 RepID=A0A926D1V7_9FIRM|nr:ATP-binding cassette domain-containing protein [Luoshenia tenuis]